MLKIHHKFNLWPSRLKHGPLALSPVVGEDDELIRDIEKEQEALRDSWNLEAGVSGEELIDFWNDARRDLG